MMWHLLRKNLKDKEEKMYKELSLLEVASKIKNREVTSEEVTKEIIEHIKATEHLNALNS